MNKVNLRKEIMQMCEDYLMSRNKTNSHKTFTALLLLKANLGIDNSTPTAYAYVQNGRPHIRVNEDFYNRFGDKFESNSENKSEGKFALLTHELHHILFDHFGRFSIFDTKENGDIDVSGESESELKEKELKSMLANLATDCAINQKIEGLNTLPENYEKMIRYFKEQPEEAKKDPCRYGIPRINYDTINEKLKEYNYPFAEANAERNQSAEYYYEILLDMFKKNGGADGDFAKKELCKSSTMQTLDNHDKIREMAEKSMKEGKKDKVKEKIDKEILKNTVKEAADLVGINLEEIGLELEKDKKLSWKTILKRFINKKMKSDRQPTRKKPNRRYGYCANGKKRNHTVRLNIYEDVSGSMHSDIAAVRAAIVNLTRTSKVEFMLWAGDTEAELQGKVKRKSDLLKMPIKAGGGTSFVSPLLDIQDLSSDPIVVLTDTWGEWPDRLRNEILVLSTVSLDRVTVPEWLKNKVIDISDYIGDYHAGV